MHGPRRLPSPARMNKRAEGRWRAWGGVGGGGRLTHRLTLAPTARHDLRAAQQRVQARLELQKPRHAGRGPLWRARLQNKAAPHPDPLPRALVSVARESPPITICAVRARPIGRRSSVASECLRQNSTAAPRIPWASSRQSPEGALRGASRHASRWPLGVRPERNRLPVQAGNAALAVQTEPNYPVLWYDRAHRLV
jgi:hypothetical protein